MPRLFYHQVNQFGGIGMPVLQQQQAANLSKTYYNNAWRVLLPRQMGPRTSSLLRVSQHAGAWPASAPRASNGWECRLWGRHLGPGILSPFQEFSSPHNRSVCGKEVPGSFIRIGAAGRVVHSLGKSRGVIQSFRPNHMLQNLPEVLLS